jgi:phenylacetate-CoA ligase
MKLSFSRKNIWDHTPTFLKSSVGHLLRHIPPDILLGRNFRNNQRFLIDAEWWSREKNLEYQLTEIQGICQLAGHTSFYKKVFSDYNFDPHKISSHEDLLKLPTINRDTINKHLSEMCTVSPQSSQVDYITTGGTSGVPLRFYIGSNRSAIEFPYLLQSWKRMPLAVFRGRIVQPDKNGLYHEHDPLLNHHYYSNFHMNDDNMEKYLQHISTLEQCFLHVFPSSIANLARFLRRSGKKPPENIIGILAESENVYPDQRKLVEQVFKVPYFSSYGHTEKLIAAAECEKSTNYHVWPTYGYFELLDEHDKTVTIPGKRGEIVGTGFINKVIPFIRYRTGDFATYIDKNCNQCGREHVIIADISGHNVQENLVSIDGSLIPWSAVNMHDDTFDNVLQYQMYQNIPGKGILKIVPAPGFSEKDKKLILQNLGKKFTTQFTFELSLVETIPLSKRGKAIFVDQHIHHNI